LQAVVGGKKGGLRLDLLCGVGFFHYSAGEGVFASGERGCELAATQDLRET